MRATKRFTFDAAHYLPEYDGPCKRLHGHTYVCEVSFDRPVDPLTGMVMDFSEIKRLAEAISKEFDHRLINEIITNPTAEMMVLYIARRIQEVRSDLSHIRLYETPDSWIDYSPGGDHVPLRQ